MFGTRTLIAAGLTTALVVAGALALPALGQSGGSDQAVEIALYDADPPLAGGDAHATLDADAGKVSVNQLVESLSDADGNAVGQTFWDCTNAEPVGWFCTLILDLDAGPYTEDGTIVIQGLFDGFNGETLAVTGGTGAYANARGDATLALEGDRLVRIVHLLRDRHPAAGHATGSRHSHRGAARAGDAGCRVDRGDRATDRTPTVAPAPARRAGDRGPQDRRRHGHARPACRATRWPCC